MKNIAIAFISLMLANTGFALPPSAIVHIEKIEGIVVGIPDSKTSGMVSILLKVTSTSDPEATKALYSTIRRKTRYPIQDLKRPARGQVILVLRFGENLPKGTKIGDKVRVLGYAVRGSDVGTSPAYCHPEYSSIERNPKG